MSKGFYGRLAAVNIRKNGRIFLPYILIGVFTVAMFYIMLFIALNKGVLKMPGAQALSIILMLGSIVIGIFSFIILLYTNSFLMKRRLKEIGLYNILGMGKKHIARVMSLETVYVALIAIAAGLFMGILLSKLMLMLLLKLLTFAVPFGFEISPIAVGVTVVLFAGIYIATLLINLGRIGLSKPIELLYGGNVGEKEPKTKWPLVVLGILSLGVGYTIAIVTDNPLQALGWFFIAVILVILGTFCLFIAGSIALLKALRKNKRHYYQTKHFTTVSGMLYRMKQNAAGLANICVLSTMVLVMLSTTVSLYLGMENALHNRFPRQFEITSSHLAPADILAVEAQLDEVLAQNGATAENVSRYRYDSYTLSRSDSHFSFMSELSGGSMGGATVIFLPLEEYNRLQGTSLTLSDNELLLYSPSKPYNDDTVAFGTLEYSVKEKLTSLNIDSWYTMAVTDNYYFVAKDEQSIKDIYDALTGGSGKWNGLSYYNAFDTALDGKGQLALGNALDGALHDAGNQSAASAPISIASAEENRFMFLSVYGGLFFLGIFLGTLFIMATVIIMYYKQISEGYDDKKRFEIMQKVGLSHEEIRKTIVSQVLTVFFLPLAAAGIHILAAFKMITKLLYLLNLTNVRLFAECTLGTFAVFAVIYAAVYALTARAYYRIVS
jgi:putative ABC transport system permease protein